MVNTVGTTIKEINKSKPKNAYFLKGNDYFLQDFFIKNLNKKFDENLTPVYLNLEEDDDIKILLNSTSNNLLFYSKNIYVIRNFSKIKTNDKEEIISSCNLENNDNVLIFIVDDFYAKNVFFKELSKHAIVVDTRTPFPNKIKEWVNYILSKKGLIVNSSYLNDIVASHGDDISNILSEIDKIYLYTNNNKIDSNNKLVSDYINRGIRPWNLLDAIGSKNLEKSIKLLHSLLINGFTGTAIIINFTNLYKEILLTVNNSSNNEYNGLNKIINNNINKYLSLYSNEELENIMVNLRNIDYSCKTTSLNPEYLIVIFITRVCTNYYR